MNRLILKAGAEFEITIRTDHKLVIRGSIGKRTWCPICGSETGAVSVTAANAIADAVVAELGPSLANSEIHLLPPDNGSKRQVCLKSLLDTVRRRSAAAGIDRQQE